MLDINRHRFYLVQILKDVYSDIELANYMGFKGGSALMFFYDLPRFSVDLDFNLLDNEKQDFVFKAVRKILLKYGKIFDEAVSKAAPCKGDLDYDNLVEKLENGFPSAAVSIGSSYNVINIFIDALEFDLILLTTNEFEHQIKRDRLELV